MRLMRAAAAAPADGIYGDGSAGARLPLRRRRHRQPLLRAADHRLTGPLTVGTGVSTSVLEVCRRGGRRDRPAHRARCTPRPRRARCVRCAVDIAQGPRRSGTRRRSQLPDGLRPDLGRPCSRSSSSPTATPRSMSAPGRERASIPIRSTPPPRAEFAAAVRRTRPRAGLHRDRRLPRGGEHRRRCSTRCRARCTGCRVSVLVVDDGSDDGTAEVAEAHGAFVCASPAQPRPGCGAAPRVSARRRARAPTTS